MNNQVNNVLGLTTLTGSKKAKYLISTLFDEFIIFSDNDFNSVNNTGLLNAQKMAEYLRSEGKKVKIELPSPGNKDMTDQFMEELKFKLLS